MAQQGSPLAERGAMRIAAFELIQELQSGNSVAAAQLEGLVDRAAAAGFDEVVRVGLFGQAINSWMQQDGLSTAWVRSTSAARCRCRRRR